MDESILVLLVFVGIALLTVAIHIIVYIKKIRPLRKPYLEERKKEKKEEKERKKATKIKHNPSEEQEIKTVFITAYSDSLDKLQTKFKNASTELLPYLYTISDIAAFKAGYDRHKIKKIVFEFIEDILTEVDADIKDFTWMLLWTNKRIELYGEVVRGFEPKGVMFRTDNPPQNSNSISRCSLLLSDILLDDDFSTLEEYRQMDFYTYDPLDTLENCDIIIEVTSIATKMHNRIYEIVKRR